MTFSFSTTASGESIQQEDIEVPDKFVRGYFNKISFESEIQNTHLEFTHPEASQVYNWTYDEGWTGDLDFIDLENTSHSENQWTIRIAIYDDEPEGEWNLKLGVDGEEHNFDIEVVNPNTSFSVSGDINFYLEPYQENTFSDEESITFSNSGNVRMKVDVNYEDDNLTYEVSQEIFHPGDSGQITFQYISSTGGLIEFGEAISIEPFPIGTLDLDLEGNIGVGSRASYGLNIGVTVGYQGYEQAQADNYEVQYLNSMEVDGYTHNNMIFFVYPHEDIDFDVEGTNVEIIDVSEDTDEPLSPGEEEEIEITVHFKSHHENDGEIQLILEDDEYITEIQLSEIAPQPGNEEVSFIEEEAETMTLGAIFIGVLLFIGLGRIWLNKRKKKED